MSPEQKERPYVTWHKRKDQIDYSEKVVFYSGIGIALLGIIATILHIIK